MRNVQHAKTVVEFKVLDFLTGYSAMGNDIQTMNNDQASFRDKYTAGVDLLTNLAMDALLLTGIGEEARAGDLVEKGAVDVGQQLLHTAEDGLTHLGCSFTSATLVATVRGQQAIGTLHVGDKVLAYNPKTHKMERQPILHVWIHPDYDLVDLTITTPAKGAHNATLKATSEVVHTNQKHPFLTTEHGFLPVGQITVGMHVVRADGRIGVITRWTIVPGAKMMYNLEVAQDHTFTVGDGQWVVHNCGEGIPTLVNDTKVTLYRAIGRSELNDVLKFGDYGLSPNESGKYFALTEQGARDFAKSSFNAGRQMTITSIETSSSWLEKGHQFFDSGGARQSIHFADEVLVDLYKSTGLPNILEASWIPNFGG
jgi:hypothetical protein